MALNNVPLTGQSLGVTKVPINQNFAVIDAAFQVDHVDFNVAGQGKHNQVTLPVQSPAPAFAAGEEGIYNFLNATTVVNELYIHKQTSVGTAEIPATASILSQSVPAMGAPGWTMLPSGIILRWETFTAGGPGLRTVTLSPGYINFTTIYAVLATPLDPSAGDVNFAVRLVQILNNTQFQLYFSSRTTTGPAVGSAQLLIIGS